MEKLDKVIAGDLISRSALLSKVEWEESYMGTGGTEYVLVKHIREAPAVEAEPVVHAHWNGDCCSACDELAEENYPRCPHCGAHMDEEVAE